MQLRYIVPIAITALILTSIPLQAETIDLSSSFPAIKEKNWFLWYITFTNSSEKGTIIAGFPKPTESLTLKKVIKVNLSIDKVIIGEEIKVDYSFNYTYDWYDNGSLTYSGAAANILSEEFSLNSTNVIHLIRPQFILDIPIGFFINIKIATTLPHDNDTYRLYGQVLNLIVFRNSSSLSPQEGVNITVSESKGFEKDTGVLAKYVLMNVTRRVRYNKYSFTNVTIEISLHGSNVFIGKTGGETGIPTTTYYLIIGFIIFDAILAFFIYKKK